MKNITADTYTGRHTIVSDRRSDVFTARELSALACGKVVVYWEFAGHVNGRPLFCRHRFMPQADGSLAGFDSKGACKIVHPADREIRILTK